jgi:hypothetical protein
MVFHNQPQPRTQNPHPYTEEMWEKIKLQHKYNKVLFALLERTIIDDFFKGKTCMNPSKDPPSNEFNEVLEKWISRSIDRNHMGLVHLELHYKVDPLLELDNLKDAMNGCSRNVDFLNNNLGRTFVVFSITNSLHEDLNVCFLLDWKSVFLSLLSMKVIFQMIVCICDQKSFNNLVIIL